MSEMRATHAENRNVFGTIEAHPLRDVLVRSSDGFGTG